MEKEADAETYGQAEDELIINDNGISWLSHLYESRSGADFTIVIGEKVIHGHRNILSLAIPYFTAMFSTGLREKEIGKVLLNDIDPDATEMIIKYVYTGMLKINRDNWRALIITADFLQLQDITNHCCHYLEKNLDFGSLFQIKHLPILTNFPKLMKRIDDFIIENFHELSERSELLDLSFEALMNIISRNELKIQSELNTFVSLMKWVKHDLEARKLNLAQLFKEIRLHLISKEDLIKFISREPLITEDKECNGYLYRALSYHILPDERSHSRELWTRTRNQSKESFTGTRCFGEEIICILRRDNANYRHFVMEKLKLEPFSTEIQEIPHPITFNNAALIDKKLYMIGDSDECPATNRVIVLDLHTKEYAGAAFMNFARKMFGVAVIEDKIYVLGGIDINGYSLDSMECFSPAENKWVMKCSMSKARYSLVLVVLDGKIYIIGNSYGSQSVERYDPVENVWTGIVPMIIQYYHIAAAVHDGKIFVSGAITSLPGSPTTTIFYDPDRGTWILGPTMIHRRYNHHLVKYHCKLYAIGGKEASGNYMDSIEELKPDSTGNGWRWMEVKQKFKIPSNASIHVVKL